MSLLGLALGLSAAGTAVGTGVNMYENQKNRSFNAEQADLARIYNLYMDNTKYQRAVKDMQKAGLNPAMLFSGAGGGGASTPNSAVASASGSSNVFANTINAAANFAAAFNYDKDKSNNVNLNQITKATSTINKNFFSDLDKVKI
jgi:hypothetical protein